MTEELGVQTVSDSVMSIEQSRAIQEVQASLVIAKKFPRDQDAAYVRIMKACERYSLADQAEYAYPRGNKTVSGPSIRLAEILAQNWGNLNFGIRELSQANGESEVEAFAWDLETNVKQTKTFTVKHKRYSRAQGNVDLSDPRDIYEHTANQGARRMRACILGVIPGDIVESAQQKCRATVQKGVNAKPLSDQTRVTLKNLDNLGVTQDMIEKRLGHKTSSINADELIELNNIKKSIQDNMTGREEWFDVKGEQQKKADDLTDKIKDTPAAQDLKAKLDAGDEQVEGYENLKGDTPEQPDPYLDGIMKEEEPEPTPLEQGEPKGILPDGVDPIAWLLTSRGKSSPINADLVMRVFKAEKVNVDSQPDEIKAKLRRKYKDVMDYLADIEANKKEIAEDPPPPFVRSNTEGYDANGRLAFITKMREYKGKDSDKYAKVLMDNSTEEKPLNDMNAVEPGDEEAILGFMSVEFGE